MPAVAERAVPVPARWWSLIWRVLVAFLVGLGSAALLGRVVDPFLFAVVVASLVAGACGLVLCGQGLQARWQVLGSPAGALVRILVGGLVCFATAFVLVFGPLNVDRSFSVWMLKRVADAPGRSQLEVKQELAEFFSPDSGEVSRRIDEQVLLGNLRIEGDNVTLTSSGRRVVWANEALSRIFGLNPRYAQGQNLPDGP